MGLFNFSKKDKNQPDQTTVSSSGFYAISGKSLMPLNELSKSGSHNDISESLGYTFDMCHGVLTFESNVIEYIAFKRRTKDSIYVQSKDKNRLLTYSDVEQIIQEIDWGFEWRQLDYEDETT